jgi:hypothetical protein
VVLGNIVLWLCTGGRVLLGEVGVKSDMSRSPSKRRRLTQVELRALGATPGLLVRRIGTDGRSRVEQLAPDSGARRKYFAQRLTRADEVTESSEESMT